jgi:hypothetical protein
MRYPSPRCDIGILFFQAFQAGNDLLYRTPWENSILLYEFYKTLDCDTSWLGHDERSEECSNRTMSQCV